MADTTDPRVDALQREDAVLAPVYGHLPFVPQRAAGCDIVTADGRHILDLYGGHAVAALGYSHPRLTQAVTEQTSRLLFQSNAVAMEVRAAASEKLCAIAPDGLTHVFHVNSGAEANENALRIACASTGRKKVLAVTHGFHGRTAAAAAVTWNAAESWYGFPQLPFEVDFIPRDDVEAALDMITSDVAAVIFEPIQGIAGAHDLSPAFVLALRQQTRALGALLIADEVQCGMGRSGRHFACEYYGVAPDLLTNAKSLAGGLPAGVVLMREDLAAALKPGALGSTFGGGPIAAAAICAVIDAIEEENLLQNVRDREAQIRESCVGGTVQRISGMGLLLGLHLDQPAVEIRNQLLEQDILTGLSSDPQVLRLLPPLVLNADHVERLADELHRIQPAAA